MEERAAIPPGLPRPNPTVSYWQDPPSHLAEHRTTQELPNTIDVLIIGSGITGSSLAYNIVNVPHPPSVLMLEARTACSGATGHNGGQKKCPSYRDFKKEDGSVISSRWMKDQAFYSLHCTGNFSQNQSYSTLRL